MAEAGVNLVTVGVFSWSRLQPAPGELTAGWLDRVLDLLADAGIRVDLATATASPPAWLVAAHPEILPVTADGTRLALRRAPALLPERPGLPGGRRRPRRADGRSATRSHPAVAMWHIGNEYGCHVPACYCDQSAEAFRHWLQARYGDIERLNDAWGGAVWSQDYTRLGPGRAAPHRPHLRQPGPAARLRPLQLRRAARLLPRRARGARRAQPRQAGHDQLHGAVPPGGPVPVVRRARRRVRGQLPRPGRRRGARGLGHGLRPDPVGRRRAAVAADGAGPERR